ncbi:hypothetical protein [Tahibacter amnicola]|uniref:Sel1 repeat-containing protein n=1 Tax=Tahibacter amnicola TaxID=2976241 RepID=A0ABY6BNN6_9GAMM|nr:hypothetical protein [Tahibacter amnicola]UXI70670.1 hypothetical protein N4264_11135 [Tahibacter amnicola]
MGQQYGVYAPRAVCNYSKAAKWFERGAELGHAASKYEYGYALLTALGVARDLNRGLAHIRSAAELGNRLALQFLLDTESQHHYGFALLPQEAEALRQRLDQLED